MHKNEIEQLVNIALQEDVASGDVTSNLTISEQQTAEFYVISKEELILCGTEFFNQTFRTIDPDIELDWNFVEGEHIPAQSKIISGYGNARAILAAERVALNFMQYLSAIATKTNKFVKLAKQAEILDTRKTLPLYRNAAKYAVRVGGGTNHRMRLDDQILIKDNHISAAGGIKAALEKTQNSQLTVEIECETLEQVKEAADFPADIIMLDNMDIATLEEAIKIIAKRSKIEVSGNITLDNLAALNHLAVDYISVGALTHSAQAIDLSLKIKISV